MLPYKAKLTHKQILNKKIFKASVKKAKKAYQKAHKDFHDHYGDIEESNALKRLMNKAKKELASLEGKTPDIKKLEVEARKLNRLLGK